MYVVTHKDGCKPQRGLDYASPEKAMAACARRITSRINEHQRQLARLRKLLAKAKAGKLRVCR